MRYAIRPKTAFSFAFSLAFVLAVIPAEKTYPQEQVVQETGASERTDASDTGMSPVGKLIRGRLNGQVADWNAGNIDSFMRVYWRSPKLSFSSGGKVTRGWQETLDGYKSRYPDKATMGKLSFSELEVTELAETVALVLGKWHLERKSPLENVGGNFSLVFRKLEGEWLIVHDHTSVLKE